LCDREIAISVAPVRDVEAEPRSTAFTPETIGNVELGALAASTFLEMHAQEPCNYDYYDHNADDVKNVHGTLQQGRRAVD
jgi:hypothetical protein